MLEYVQVRGNFVIISACPSQGSCHLHVFSYVRIQNLDLSSLFLPYCSEVVTNQQNMLECVCRYVRIRNFKFSSLFLPYCGKVVTRQQNMLECVQVCENS